MEKELGREESLRLLWPVIVGSKLGSNTRFQALRHRVLVIAVPDRTWKNNLEPLEKMILDAVCRFCGEEAARMVEFVEDRRLENARPVPRAKRLQPAEVTVSLDFPLEAIRDPELRESFARSARKYLGRQEVRTR